LIAEVKKLLIAWRKNEKRPGFPHVFEPSNDCEEHILYFECLNKGAVIHHIKFSGWTKGSLITP
jgi:hypothetical protein